MHIKAKNDWIKHLDFIAINLATLILSFVCAYCFKFGDLGFAVSSSWKTVILILCLINLVVTFMMSPYSGIFRRPYYEDVVRQFLLGMYTFITVSIFFYLMKIGADYSRITITVTFVLYFFLSSLFIYLHKKLLLSGRIRALTSRTRKLFVIADPGSVSETAENIAAGDIQEYEIVGYCFPGASPSFDSYRGRPVLPIDRVAEHITTENIDDVFVAVSPSALSGLSFETLVDNGVTVHMGLESITGTEGDDQFISRIGVYKAASIGPYAFDAKRLLYLVIKRGFDILLGVIGCILLLPLSAAVKLSYLASGDHAPIIYRQTRIGQYGKTFQLYKFRSMVANADEVLEELLKDEKYKKEWAANQKIDNDPRITKIGRRLRRTSLDEFPQFINVLKGDMSLVGPRPLVEGELTDHNGRTLYNRVKPGITGWWACNGRSNINYRERLELEYYYVKNLSLYLDILCIVRSALAVLRRDGAQ